MAFREPPWNRLAAGGGNCNVPPWGAFKLTYISVRVVSMRVGVSVLSTDGRLRGFAGRAAGRGILRSGCCAAAIAAALLILPSTPTWAETLPEVLVRTYQGNPVLNAERARLRGIDETVPMAVAAYRPQIMAMLTGGLQQVRVLFPDNTVQTATLRTWTIGLTVSQTLFNGFKTANTVRQSEANVRSGREALRNVGQGVLLDAVTAYTNVLANQTLVEAQRINSTFLRETLGTTRKRLDAGDVTPTDVAQAEARQSRGLADLNAAEVNLAISQAVYAQVTGAAPGRLAVAEPVDRLLPRTREEAVAISRKDHPAILAAMYDTDVAQLGTKIAESSLWPNLSVQGSVQRQWENDPTLSAKGNDIASVIGQANVPIYDGGFAAAQIRQSKELAMQARIVLELIRNQTQTAVIAAWASPRRSEGRALGRGIRSARGQRGALRRAEGGAGRPAHDAGRAQLAAGSDGGARPPHRRAAGPGDRGLCPAQRHRTARREDARPQHPGLLARGPLPAGARRLGRPAHAVGTVVTSPSRCRSLRRSRDRFLDRDPPGCGARSSE